MSGTHAKVTPLGPPKRARDGLAGALTVLGLLGAAPPVAIVAPRLLDVAPVPVSRPDTAPEEFAAAAAERADPHAP